MVVRRLTELNRSVEGRVVLVTGAGGGQGRSTAHLFADEGAHVAVTDLGQAEDGIRDHCVTGVQTCALPICT